MSFWHNFPSRICFSLWICVKKKWFSGTFRSMASSGMSSETGGVKPMAIGGRLVRERERLFGMTDAERAWRKQFLKDQILAPHEPVHVPQYYREITNPVRRFYQWPLNKLWEILTPSLVLALHNSHNLSRRRILTFFGFFRAVRELMLFDSGSGRD